MTTPEIRLRRQALRTIGLCTLAMAGLVVAAPALAEGGAVGDAPLLKAGEKAPQFGPVKLHNPAEAGMQTFVLGKYAGDEPETATKGVLISFFATWCGP